MSLCARSSSAIRFIENTTSFIGAAILLVIIIARLPITTTTIIIAIADLAYTFLTGAFISDLSQHNTNVNAPVLLVRYEAILFFPLYL